DWKKGVVTVHAPTRYSRRATSISAARSGVLGVPDKLSRQPRNPPAANDARAPRRPRVSAEELLVGSIAIERRSRTWLQRLVQAATLLVALSYAPCLLAEPQGDIRDYRLEPGDRITVSVFGHAQLSGDVLVDGIGNVLL